MTRCLQTFCPYGALPLQGKRGNGDRVLQTFCPYGASEVTAIGCYKHFAPTGQAR
jgi:hypothetical protein